MNQIRDNQASRYSVSQASSYSANRYINFACFAKGLERGGRIATAAGSCEEHCGEARVTVTILGYCGGPHGEHHGEHHDARQQCA